MNDTHYTHGALRRSALALGGAFLLLACGGEAGPGAIEIGPVDPSGAGAVGAGAPGNGPAGTVGGGSAGGSDAALAGSGSPSSTAGASGGAGASAGGGGGSPSVAAVQFEPHPALLRRLTRSQFANALGDLLGANVDVSQLELDSFDGHFATVGASTAATSALGVERYHTAVELAVDDLFANTEARDALVGCTPQSATDSCLRDFVEVLGRRAWRRGLDPAEVDQLLTVAATAEQELGDMHAAAHWTVVAILTSPNFLYRAELGQTAPDGTFQYSAYERASRLSFLIWDTIPDDALLVAAESGALDTKEGVKAAVQRMLDAPASREAVGAFAEQYMRLDRVLTQAKDAERFPEYGPALQTAMVRDMRAVWEINAMDGASLLELFTTDQAYVNAELARIYGLSDEGLDAETFELRRLPADSPRKGILGKLGFLSQFANQTEGSPTLRGKFIREALMCVTVPPPPGDAIVDLPDPPEGQVMTKRERLAMHREEPACAGCHALMDPLGLPFESFDAVGRYRTTDEGLPVDPSGEFEQIAVADSVELGEVMSASTTIAGCIVKRYYAYAVGHEPRAVDIPVLQELTESFEASGYRFKNLLVDLATSDAFAAVAPQGE